MRYFALATDYDGTIATAGVVDPPTLDALRRLRESGRRVILVTGRELDDLIRTFPQIALCDRVVAENGALLYDPATKEAKPLSPPAPETFVAELKRRGVGPISVGRAIVATWEPHQETVLQTIRDQGLELQVIFNKGAVMILPSGVNKATGLKAVLKELGLSLHNVVGVGDAENDHAFLSACEFCAAVDNALPSVKERVDFVSKKDHGPGVSELIEAMIGNDLADFAPRLNRHCIPLGKRTDGMAEYLDPYGINTLVCGTSGSGKSTIVTGLLERLNEAGYQSVVIDPEGDYSALEFAVVLGSPQRAPLIEEILALLRHPGRSGVLNLLGVALDHRPAFFGELMPRLLDLRARTGRPHWLVIDEAHHLLPTDRPQVAPAMTGELKGLLLITVHPERVARVALRSMDTVLAVGSRPAETVADFCKAIGEPMPQVTADDKLTPGDAILWRRGTGEAIQVRTEPPKIERRRHSRKYAEGNVGADRSFYFVGPEGKLHLKAQNLQLFMQIADGVDDATWEFHLRNGDIAGWLRQMIKNPELADEVIAIERAGGAPSESRTAVRAAIEKRYTLPVDEASGDQSR